MKSYVRLLTVCAAAVSFLMTACHKKDHPTTPLSKQDQYFAEKAGYANLNEADAGALAAAMAVDSVVKAFGQHMIAEHTEAYADLKAITDRSNYGNLPTTPDSAHIALKDSLSRLTGRAFDSAYIVSQVKDHQTALILFQTEASDGSGELQNYAAKYVPHIQEHLAKADSILAGF